MKVEQSRWGLHAGWIGATPKLKDVQLVFAFGGRDNFEDAQGLAAAAAAYPGAQVVGCTTSGEIYGGEVTDESLVITAIRFDEAHVKVEDVNIRDFPSSEAAGLALAQKLPVDDLVHALVFSDGHLVNGSALVEGLRRALPAGVAVTGGLAGDAARFERTFVLSRGRCEEGRIAIVGLYGRDLRVGFGSLGGWDPFGPERRVTRAKSNVLSELDGLPALALYKKYLGEHAAGLPATGLLFPLSVRTPDGREYVRTILGVDEERQTLTFAGDIPEGSYARLMKANFDRLIDGAQGAAKLTTPLAAGHPAEFALLISCVGRKLVLKQRTEDEVDAVREVIGRGAAVTGFYSYGEICPAAPDADCELHNQTMTITTFSEN